jgi:hypothetical protein
MPKLTALSSTSPIETIRRRRSSLLAAAASTMVRKKKFRPSALLTDLEHVRRSEMFVAKKIHSKAFKRLLKGRKKL